MLIDGPCFTCLGLLSITFALLLGLDDTLPAISLQLLGYQIELTNKLGVVISASILI